MCKFVFARDLFESMLTCGTEVSTGDSLFLLQVDKSECGLTEECVLILFVGKPEMFSQTTDYFLLIGKKAFLKGSRVNLRKNSQTMMDVALPISIIVQKDVFT